MIAKPANCARLPFQMNGMRRHPSTERCVSELYPIIARNGAATRGSAIMNPTSEADTPSSTIMTRLSVPTRRTIAIPTDT
jgi:hypothetical protein